MFTVDRRLYSENEKKIELAYYINKPFQNYEKAYLMGKDLNFVYIACRPLTEKDHPQQYLNISMNC